ncbi:YjjI family glycine radical enzyme [Endozoicomonas gorgoniicola]|uniref:YjjI family glycine radical enzyme n=1 Tax=Endozoicomonas gorgoniicola TaxID=1234144 RepID=A0ABT3MX11_9GAMM|nr:YjjI family glycine radical enzyme [Endozoicomonas gorgoniicola]MCW7553922.1 YjjI family glycine radical enzyme [Endozoicomonas gorgoniicola]
MSYQQALRQIVNDSRLNTQQKARYLSLQAESMLDCPRWSEGAQELLDSGVVCDMFEGNAPFKPRYVMPDYEKALKKGSDYLELEAPEDLDEAINFLLILFNHVPSVTGMPVFVGRLDKLLMPFVNDGISDDQLKKKIKLMWQMIDRTLPDAFLHANIGPEDNRVARAILSVDGELEQVVPNLTLRYDPEITSDGLLNQAIENISKTNKPHIANEALNVADFKALGDYQGYGIASCYNCLPLAGGAHTLVRMNLLKAAQQSEGSEQDFLERVIPEISEKMYEIIQARVNYLVNDSGFYKESFLVRERFIDPNRFTAMFGVFGMAEAVNHLLGVEAEKGYGHTIEAKEFAIRITEKLAAIVESTKLENCWHSRALFHSQSGISIDAATSAGCRIPYGVEPSTLEHILTVIPHHRHFTAGVSDIFPIDETIKNNPQALATICKGAIAQGLRMFTVNVANNDLVRVTGYMVRRSDIKKHKEEGSRINSTVFGAEAAENCGILDRKSRVISNEFQPWVAMGE